MCATTQSSLILFFSLTISPTHSCSHTHITVSHSNEQQIREQHTLANSHTSTHIFQTSHPVVYTYRLPSCGVKNNPSVLRRTLAVFSLSFFLLFLSILLLPSHVKRKHDEICGRLIRRMFISCFLLFETTLLFLVGCSDYQKTATTYASGK